MAMALQILGDTTSSNTLVAKKKFVHEGRHQILAGVESLVCQGFGLAGGI